MGACIIGNETLVGIRLGVGFGAQKQHVLQEVRQPLQVFRVLCTADPHVHGGRRLVGAGVADQQRLQAIFQRQHSIVTLVEGADGGGYHVGNGALFGPGTGQSPPK